MAATATTRARADIVRLAHRGMATDAFSRAAARALRKAVPFDGFCVLTFDPATLLPTGEVVEGGLPAAVMPRLNEIELGEPDYNKFAALARGPRRTASLSEATRGRLESSARQRELRRPNGFEDELRAALVDDDRTWGALTLLRERGTAHFSARDVRRVEELARDLADGLRRAILLGTLDASESSTGKANDDGLLVLRRDGSIEVATPAAERWLEELDSDWGLPPAIQSVANRARRAAGDEAAAPARARVRTAAGRWLTVRGSALGEGPGARVAVMLEQARGSELAPLIADAYALTPRERLVTQLVAQGLSTNDIAGRLFLSAYTVQDHLKAIFEKTGTSSRGELVARLFFEHYAPRLTVD